MTDKIIRIDLNASTDAHEISGDGLIQRAARERLQDIICAQLCQPSTDESTDGCPEGCVKEYVGYIGANKPISKPRFHNAITISGSRGSGKTTFILSYLEDLRRNYCRVNCDKNDDKGQNKECIKKIEILKIIDPTIVESKENIIVVIISNISEIVSDYYNNEKSCREELKIKYEKFEESLKKLADGLSVLDGVGSPSQYGEAWDDSHIVMQSLLGKARGGNAFSDAFDTFIKDALALLCKDAFLLAFDDIDTQFKNGWLVLESIRKYLTSPKLVILLSGDLALYAKLVRRAQFVNLGNTYLRHDRPSRDYHPDKDLSRRNNDAVQHTVGQLEEQYLLKVLKPENRVHLWTLADIIERKPGGYGDVVVHLKGKDKDASLADIVDKIFNNALSVQSTEELKLYRTALLGQPVRTVIQFLQAAMEFITLIQQMEQEWKTLGENKWEQGEEQNWRRKWKLNHENNWKQYLDDFFVRLPDVFASALFHSNLNPALIAAGDEDALIREFVTWNNFSDVWETGYRLRPEYIDHDSNMVSMTFAAQLSRLFSLRTSSALSFMIKIGLTREFILQKGDVTTADEIVNFLGINMRERTGTITRRAVGVQRSLVDAAILRVGTIPVAGSNIDTASALLHLYGVDWKENEKDKDNDKESINNINKRKAKVFYERSYGVRC